MIIKGQAFTFMYETRNKNTGALVPDASATHTITVFYQGSSGWTSAIITANNGQNGKSPVVYNASSPAFPAYVGSTDTGLYLCQISSSYTDCEHVIVSITSSNTDVIVPVQQFYPVDLSPFASNIAQSVWTYGDPTNGGSRSGYRTLIGDVSNPEITYSSVANAVWTYGDDTINTSTHTRSVHRQITSRELADAKATPDKLALKSEVTVTLDSDDVQLTLPDVADIAAEVWSHNGRSLDSLSVTSGSTTKTLITTSDLTDLQDHGDLYWTGSGSTSGTGTTSVTIDTAALATQVGRLESYVDTLATNVGYLSSNVQAINTAATTLFTGTNNLASVIDNIPHDVWTYTTYSDIANHQPVKAIADTVWGRSQNGTNRQLTSATLGAVGAGALAKSTDVAAPVIDSEDIQLTIPTAIDVATAVWNYGKATNAEITDYRALSTPTIIAKNGTTSLDVATVSAGSSTVDNVVWGAQTRTLSSEVLDNTKSLAVSTDIPEAPDVSDLTTIVTLLTKVLGVLCHWKEDGNNIIVYNDDNETILTISTVKNKYGDILQMGEIPEEE